LLENELSFLQVWNCDETSCILVATPSNSAADLVAQRLLEDVPEGK